MSEFNQPFLVEALIKINGKTASLGTEAVFVSPYNKKKDEKLKFLFNIGFYTEYELKNAGFSFKINATDPAPKSRKNYKMRIVDFN